MAQKEDVGGASHANMDADYVLVYRFTDTEKSAAQSQFEKLVQALVKIGLAVAVRNGDKCSLLVFVKAADERRFNNEVYKYRVRDWLYGVRAAQPDREAHTSSNQQPLTDAERLRIVHHLITSPTEEGGAGITPKIGQWKNVESLFPLHDYAFNKNWIKKWSTETLLSIQDLDEIRNRLGEKIAFYFAFTQSYFTFLVIPAGFGIATYALLGHFSFIYAVVITLWTVTFVEYWKHQELDLAVRWNVKGVSQIQEKRHDFKWEKEIQDPVTGETIRYFPPTKRLARQALQIPFALLAGLLLGSLLATCFGIEVFLSEVYSGPYKSVLIYIPTGLLTVLTPTVTTILSGIAKQINDFENHQTTASYDAALTSKIFVLNFITSYLPIFLTAFVYVPFGSVIVPYLDILNYTAAPFAEKEDQLKTPKAGFEINPGRLRKQVVYFAVTAQVVNFLTEVVVPYVKRQGFQKVQEIKTERAAKKGGAAPGASIDDSPEEADFLKRVRKEAELDVYDVSADLREMVVQFGYLAFFSVVWPLVPVSFLINNWVELRSDAVKICIEMQRPTPYRADGIGPWLDALGFQAWLGSITTAALVHMFSNDGIGPDGNPSAIQAWALLLTIFFSEHIYLVVREAVRFVISKLHSPGMDKERGERYALRKRILKEQFGEQPLELPPPSSEKITRESLEEDARKSSLQSTTPVDRFWARQRSWDETAKVGAALIDEMAADEGKKQK